MVRGNYKSEIIIKKTIGEVFRFVSNLSNFPLWTGASNVEIISETPNNVGSIYKVIFSTFLTKSSVSVEIVEYIFPNTFSFRDNSKQILFHYTFKYVEEGAKVSLNCELDDSPFSFSRLKMDNLLEDLKKYIETHSEDQGFNP